MIIRRRPIAVICIMLLSLAAAPAAVRSQRLDPTSLGFQKKFAIEISNPGPLSLDNHPVILDVAEIRKAFPDFNTSSYAIFEEIGLEFALVVSQPDDVDRDKIPDEIVLIRTLPAGSTARLVCYYSPQGSFQLMATPVKAAARLGWDAGKSAAGWESNLCAYSLANGRIEFFAKFVPDLVLKHLTADMPRRQDWGMAVLEAGETSGLGGLSLWDGQTRIPLANPEGKDNVKAQNMTLASGPLRALVRTDVTAFPPGGPEYRVSLTFSAFADSQFSRLEVDIPSEPGSGFLFGPGIQKLPAETWTLNEGSGFAAAWGEGAKGAGEIGLAVIFPPDAFAGLEETGLERFVKLRPGAKMGNVFWILGGWEKGIHSPLPPRARNWVRQVQAVAEKLRARVEIRFGPA